MFLLSKSQRYIGKINKKTAKTAHQVRTVTTHKHTLPIQGGTP